MIALFTFRNFLIPSTLENSITFYTDWHSFQNPSEDASSFKIFPVFLWQDGAILSIALVTSPVFLPNLHILPYTSGAVTIDSFTCSFNSESIFTGTITGIRWTTMITSLIEYHGRNFQWVMKYSLQVSQNSLERTLHPFRLLSYSTHSFQNHSLGRVLRQVGQKHPWGSVFL